MRWSKAIPTNLDKALQEINPSIFPNLFTMLKVVKTLPVSSWEAERSFSTLRRLNTWLRSSMGNSRLSNLARIHIHRDQGFHSQNFCAIFAERNAKFFFLCASVLREKTTICAIICISHFVQNCPIPLLRNSSFAQFHNFVPKSETHCPIKVSTILVLDMHISSVQRFRDQNI